MTRAPDPTANFFSDGDQRTHVAARLIRKSTSVGLYPVGEGSQTRAFRSVGLFSSEAGDQNEYRTLRASNNATSAKSNIYTCDGLIVAFQLVLKLEGIPRLLVKLHVGISRDGQCLSICRKGVIRDRMMK
jgi:hypothetical protein